MKAPLTIVVKDVDPKNEKTVKNVFFMTKIKTVNKRLIKNVDKIISKIIQPNEKILQRAW